MTGMLPCHVTPWCVFQRLTSIDRAIAHSLATDVAVCVLEEWSVEVLSP